MGVPGNPNLIAGRTQPVANPVASSTNLRSVPCPKRPLGHAQLPWTVRHHRSLVPSEAVRTVDKPRLLPALAQKHLQFSLTAKQIRGSL
jgi:hypothetical protein